MKKVLVLASLSILVLSFGCGGNKATEKEKGEAGLAYMAIIENYDLPTPGATSVETDTAFPVIETPCNGGNGTVTTSGTYEETATLLTATVNTAFDGCQTVDDVCNTGEKVILDGTLKTDLELTLDTEKVSADFTGTVNLTGIFSASCAVDLTVKDLDVASIESPEDVEFSGTICGVNFEDLWNATEAEVQAMCEAVIGG